MSIIQQEFMSDMNTTDTSSDDSLAICLRQIIWWSWSVALEVKKFAKMQTLTMLPYVNGMFGLYDVILWDSA